MNISKKYSFILFFAFLIPTFLISCGDGGGDGSTGDTSTRETVTLRGSVADTMASNGSLNRNTLTARVRDIFTITSPAFAQEQQQVLEGILVEAFEGDMKVGEDTTDSSGEFMIESVPCDTPLKLIFTYQGDMITLEGISVPCTDMGDEGVISMVVSLNFQSGEGQVDDIEDEGDIVDAAFNCTSGEQHIDLNGDEYMLDGNGNTCILTDGNCRLDIRASSVVLKNCSTCIDTRGGSSVNIDATRFDCVSNKDGIRSVGNSMVDITVIASSMTDDTIMPSDSQMMQEMGDGTLAGSGNGNIFIISGEDGMDLRGSARAELAAFADGTTMSSEEEGGGVTIEGVSNGIIAVGNSDAEIDARSCDIQPGTTTKGNAEIDVDCDE